MVNDPRGNQLPVQSFEVLLKTPELLAEKYYILQVYSEIRNIKSLSLPVLCLVYMIRKARENKPEPKNTAVGQRPCTASYIFGTVNIQNVNM